MRYTPGIIALTLAIGLSSPSVLLAQRTISSKADRVSSSGSRVDITVPYLTNKGTTLGVAQGVSPIIKQTPTFESKNEPVGRPVYNLIFYGSQKGSGPDYIHATERKGNNLRPGR